MALKYWTGAHTKHRILVHVVWLPKYRKKVVNDKIARRLKNLIYEAAKANKWWIEEINILKDHIHLLIQIHPDEAISQVVQILKGGTSRVIRKEFPDLEDFLWGDNLWARGYFAETVGSTSYANIKKYIQEQEENV